MTGRQYIDEIKIRAPRHGVMVDTNDALLLSWVNTARRNMQNASMMLYPEKYGNRAFVPLLPTGIDAMSQTPVPYMSATKGVTIYTAAMPADLIDIDVALLLYTMNPAQVDAGVTYRIEMRRVNKKEFYAAQMHAWNGPTRWSPIYVLDRQMDRTPGAYPYVMYVAGLNLETIPPTTPTTLYDIAWAITIEIWYIKAVDFIEMLDNDTEIPPEMEESVINYAMMYLFENMNEIQALESIRADIKSHEINMKQNYEIRKEKEVVLLPSKEGI